MNTAPMPIDSLYFLLGHHFPCLGLPATLIQTLELVARAAELR